MATELSQLDATAQAELVRTGDASPIELVDAAITRVEKLNGELNAVIHPLFDRARAAAAASDLAGGPFRGVPIVVKDYDGMLAGAPYHAGNRALQAAGYVATETSYLFEKLERAGFVIVGKTNTPEFGLMPTAEPEAHGPTRNPWDVTRSAGRFERRFRRGRRERDGAGRARGRRRRLDPDPGEHVRAVRPEAVARSRLPRTRTRARDGADSSCGTW